MRDFLHGEQGADVTVTVRQYRSGVVEIPRGCRRIDYGKRLELLPDCDFAVSATVSPNYTLPADLVKECIRRPIVLIDLAVPRDIDPQLKDLEQIVGLQTDAPLKRAIMPFGGIRLIHTELEAYGREMDPVVEHVFKYRKTHNARSRLRCRHGKHMRALFRSDSAGRGGFGLAYPRA